MTFGTDSGPDRRSRRRLGMTIGLAGSVLVHAAAFTAMASLVALPELGFELRLPTEIEFGLTEETRLQPQTLQPTPAASRAKAEAAAPSSSELVPAKPAVKPEKPASPSESAKAEKPKKVRAKKPKPAPDAGLAEAGAKRVDAGAAPLAQYAPPGAQVALRMDMGRIRASPVVEDVRQLLAVIPDWQLILQDSGLDPIEELQRIFIASPNFQRSSLVVAGQYAGEDDVARKAVANLAAARGKPAEWRTEAGVTYAPWLNQDEVERVIALVGPKQFVISTPEDLPRVMAVARGLAERLAKEGKKRAPDSSALLAMEENEAWSLSVEGARNFVQGNLRGIPERLSVSVVELPKARVGVRAVGYYDSPQQAAKARGYWEKIRTRYASHTLLVLMGLSDVLSNAVIEQDQERLEARTELSIQQVRVVLGFLRNALTPPQSPSQTPAPETPSPTPETAR